MCLMIISLAVAVLIVWLLDAAKMLPAVGGWHATKHRQVFSVCEVFQEEHISVEAPHSVFTFSRLSMKTSEFFFQKSKICFPCLPHCSEDGQFMKVAPWCHCDNSPSCVFILTIGTTLLLLCFSFIAFFPKCEKCNKNSLAVFIRGTKISSENGWNAL